MKKKVLASLLAVAMMASLVVPAFAAKYDPSSQSGLDEEITALEFNKESITATNGGASVDLNDNLTAYAGNDKIVQEPSTLEWSIEDNLAIGLNSNGSVYAVEDSGYAMVTVKVPGKDISASIKVVAAKFVAKKAATGFKFEKTSDKTTGGAGAVTVLNVVPNADNYVFTGDQLKDMLSKLKIASIKQGNVEKLADLQKETLNANIADAVGVYDNGTLTGIKFVINGAADSLLLGGNTVKNYTIATNPYAMLKDGSITPFPVATRTTRLISEKGVQAKRIIRIASVKIEVGQTADLSKCYALTTGANYDKDVDYAMDLWSDTSEAVDYAVQDTADRNMIRGIAVGKQKARISLKVDPTQYVEVPIEVVARGTLADTSAIKLSNDTITLKVGETAKISLKGVAADKEVSWTPSNNNITVNMKTTGEGEATITGKVAGTAILFARVDGVAYTAKVTVTAADGTVPPTTNPGTGDSIFANLF